MATTGRFWVAAGGNQLSLWIGRTRWLKTRLPKVPTSAFVELPKGRKIFVDPKDMRGPSFHVMYGGARSFALYEKPEKDLILAHLPEDGVFLDVGANIGLFSFYVHWHRPLATVHAFEPHPDNLRCLKKSCQTNQIKTVFVHELAIGDHEGEIELFFDETDSGGHSTYQETLENNQAPPQSIRTPLTTLDAFVKTTSLHRVDVIKIDTQGGEAAAIRGAQKLISRFNPALLIECDYRALTLSAATPAGGSITEALQATGVPYVAQKTDEPNSRPLSLTELQHEARLELQNGKLQRNYLFTRPL
ncbi:FkbM family methyltransferase [Bdellovibrionota bacterium FG-1]